MSRKSNKEARRQQIVNALHSLLGPLGYDGASVQLIARRAGLAPGLVHYHFGNKEEILLAVLAQLEARLEQRLPTELEPRGEPLADAWASVDAWIDAHLALGEGSDAASVAAWVTLGAEALRKPSLQEAYEAAVNRDLDRATPLIGAVLAAQGADPSQARTIAVGLLAAIEGCYRLAAAAPAAVPSGFAAPSVRAMARGLLGGS